MLAASQLLADSQLYVLIIGSIVPLVTYVVNYHAPWVDEKLKAVVLVLAAAVAAGLYTALETQVFGANAETLQYVVTAVVGSLMAHKWLYVPSTIANQLGGGRNKQTEG